MKIHLSCANKTINECNAPYRLIITVAILLFLIYASGLNAQGWYQVGDDVLGYQAYEHYGYRVDVSSDGQTIVSGAYGFDTEFEDAGAVRVYSYDGSEWVQKGAEITGMSMEDELGYGVAISDDGNIFAVGATEDDDSKLRTGYVQVYNWNGSVWEQMGDNIDGQIAYERFGSYLSMSADGLVFAAHSRSGDNGEEAGSIMVYAWNGSSWIQKGNRINGNEGENYGWSLCLSSDGNSLVAGSVWGGPNSSGIVHVYEWDGTSWVQKGDDILAENEGDYFGSSVHMSDDGNTIAVGARNYSAEYNGQGQVKVFSWNGSAWEQKGEAVNGPDEYALMGWSVWMSGDGDSFVTGLPSIPNQPFEMGRTRVYEFDGISWMQKGDEIVGEAGDKRSGYSVAMNNDGSIVLVGSPWYNGSLGGEGKVGVFSYGFVDIEVQKLGLDLNIYPNPFTDYIHIEMGQVYQDVTVIVRDVSGRLISTSTYDGVETIRQEMELIRGFYIVEINITGGEKALLKLVKR